MKRPASDTPIVTTEKKATAVEAQQTEAELSSLSFYYLASCAAAPGSAVGAADGASDPSDGSSGAADDASTSDSSADDMETTLEPLLFILSASPALAGGALLRVLRHTHATIASTMRMNRSENAIAMMIPVQSAPLENNNNKNECEQGLWHWRTIARFSRNLICLSGAVFTADQ